MRRVFGMQTVVSCFAIAVIAVEPTGKAFFVYSYVQMRPRLCVKTAYNSDKSYLTCLYTTT